MVGLYVRGVGFDCWRGIFVVLVIVVELLFILYLVVLNRIILLSL